MVIITLGLGALGAFAFFGERARRGDANARAATIIEAAILWVLSGVGVLTAVYLAGAKCDESCDENLAPIATPSGEWWHTLNAWQWWAQLGAAAVGFVAVGFALVFAIKSRFRRAIGLMILAAVTFGAWAALLAPLGEGLGI